MAENGFLEPVKIVEVDDDNNIVFDFVSMKTVLSRANGKRIVIILVLGRYQMGKSSFIVLTFGNDKYEIGSGNNEQTDGATICGPYNKKQLKNRWNIDIRITDSDNEAIFVIDIEGFGSFNRYETYEENVQFYSKLYTPFLAISSCVVFFADQNENQASMCQLISMLKFNEFALQLHDRNNNIIIVPFTLLVLIRNIDKYQNKILNISIDYSNPTENNFEEISYYFSNDHPRNIKNIGKYKSWKTKMFPIPNSNILVRPLPVYNTSNNPLNQNEIYNNGFKLVMNDLLHILNSDNKRINSNNVDLICDFFSKIGKYVNTVGFSIQNSQVDFYIKDLTNRIDEIYNNYIMPMIFSKFTINDVNLLNKIEIRADILSSTIIRQIVDCFNQKINEKIQVEYLNIQQVEDEIQQIHQKINNKINSEIPGYIANTKHLIATKCNTYKQEIFIYLKPIMKRKINEFFSINVLINSNDILQELSTDFQNNMNNQLNQRISNENLEITEVETAMNDLLDEIKNYLIKKLTKRKNGCISSLMSYAISFGSNFVFSSGFKFIKGCFIKENTEIITKEITKAATDSVTKLATDAATKATTDSVTKLATDAATKATTDSVTKLATDAFAKTATDSVTKLATDAFAKAATDSTTKIVTDAATKAVIDSATNLVTDSVSKTAVENIGLAANIGINFAQEKIYDGMISKFLKKPPF